MNTVRIMRAVAATLVIGLAMSRSGSTTAGLSDYSLSQSPLFVGNQAAPLLMMVMSRDESLFKKAYSDYSDLNEDGILDLSYNNSFDYSGYFDPALCYNYANHQFSATAEASKDPATGKSTHRCSGKWSGNFLNWVSMSRLDILRWVLFGGLRSTDGDTSTVLERAHIPNDLHAWTKVYSGSDIGQFTPLSGTQTFCNASFGVNGQPLMQVASGDWSEWAATSINQCGTGGGNRPSAATDYTVRVQVCANASGNLRESFCSQYAGSGTPTYKPTGLLQEYGESKKLRFGLISGSYNRPRSGGVLRKNIGNVAGNGTTPGVCAAGDEINLVTGRFCNQEAGAEGIINTVSRFKLTQWSGRVWNDCPNWGLLNRQGQTGGNGNLNNPGTGGSACSGWGNPISEMYAEALRYIGGETAPTTAFSGSGDLPGLPSSIAWLDPYRPVRDGGNSECAACNILVLSSSLNAFDSDELPNVGASIGDGVTATAAVGALEGIGGGNLYSVGRTVDSVADLAVGVSVNTHEDLCSAKGVADLSKVRGICPDVPSLEGSYMVAGMAHKANTVDLRNSVTRTQSARTFAVAMADSLPKFEIPVGSGTITLAPLCQANGNGNAPINAANGTPAPGWRTCFLGAVNVGTKRSTVSPNHVYGRPLAYSGGQTTSGSYSLVWEDSLWGNDNDNDVVAMLSYCVGSACASDTNAANNSDYTGFDICWRSDSPVCSANGRPSVGANEVLVRIENLSAYAGNAMLTGFSVYGSDADGVYRAALRPGGTDGSILTGTADPNSRWSAPKVIKFRSGAAEVGQLQSPLWYAAKYGGFKDTNANGQPDAGEWDSKRTGEPDNYFFARNPSKLKEALREIFASAAGSGGPTSGGGAGARISSGSLTLEAGFDKPMGSNNWTGFMRAIRVNSDGSAGNVLWNAESQMPNSGSRNLWYTTGVTAHDAAGQVTSPATVATFTDGNVPNVGVLGLDASNLPAWMAGKSKTQLVNYLRGEPVAGFRYRSAVLGDIVNSNTEIVNPSDDFGYGYWSDPSASHWRSRLSSGYNAFLAGKAGNAPMVYVGANDGMLHAFNGNTGTEVFGFIPSASARHLSDLADPNYQHKYFVDGQFTVSDVSFSGTGAGDWHTVLVGSTGAGGASAGTKGNVYAINVSNPAAFGSSSLLWEIGRNVSGSDTYQDDLGYVLGKPLVVPVEGPDGAPRWVAMFGNGANSVNGLPVLFIVDIETGELLAKLVTNRTGYASRNGLMNLAPVAAFNADGLVDTVYGGDLQGNLWRFELDGGNPSTWRVGNSRLPVFTAERGGMRQPITGSIEAVTGPGGGISVLFGTGRYFVDGDNGTRDIQSLYAFVDDRTALATTYGRGDLIQQAISEGVTSNGYNTRNVSGNPVPYSVKRGWYVDLVVGSTALGERFIGTPRVQNGKVIFTTYQPSAEDCGASGGTNWLYALDLVTGGGGMSGVTLTPDGSTVCEGDCGGISLAQSGTTANPVLSSSIFVPPVVAQCDPNDPACSLTTDERISAERCTFVLRAQGAAPLYLPRPCGRQSWRQIL